MKRILMGILAWMLLCGNALAALEYNSFFDDANNAGRFASFAKAGEYVYWLDAPDDSLDWMEKPANLYRMRPGEGEAELVMQGRENFWMYDVVCIGERLLLSVADAASGQMHPAVMNLDGNFYKVLNGNIGSVVVGAGEIYNSVDGAIYKIDIDDLKPKKIYTYPDEIAAQNPVLTQCEGLDLYFVTDAFEWYRLDLQFKSLKRIDIIRGDGFVKDYKFYVSDYDNGGTYRYDLAMDKQQKVSEHTYAFLQGNGQGFVRAKVMDAAGFGGEEGVIFDITWLTDDLALTLMGSCDPLWDFMLDGRLMHYDAQENRVEYSDLPVVEYLK